MTQLTNKQKIKISDHPILRQEETEQIKKEMAFKSAFCFDIERDYKESRQVLNSYYGEY